MICKRYFYLIPLLAIASLSTTPVTAMPAGRTLKQSIVIDASIADVWSLIETEEGLKKWMAPLIELDLRVGGTIKSNYHADGVIGDDNTIVNTILAYEPQRMLSLKATNPPADFTYADAIKDMWSVMYFEVIDEGRTRVRVHGLGYRDTPDSEAMFKFFERGNEWVLQQLKKAAEANTTHDMVQGDAELDQILADAADESKDSAAGSAVLPANIEKEVIVNTPRSEVWKAWTTPEGITTFFGQAADIELRHRGPFEIYFDLDQPEGTRGSEGCEVLSWLDQEMLSFTWNAPTNFLEVRMQRSFVVLQFSDEGKGKTKLKLTHSGFGEGEQWKEVRAYFDNAWDFVLKNLVTRFDGGEVRQGKAFKPEPFKYYVYYLYPAKDSFFQGDISEADNIALTAHVQYLKRLLAEGKLILAGPSFDPPIYPDATETMIPFEIPTPGIVVFRAHNDQEAKAIMEADPAVAAGVFKARVNPFNYSFARP